MDGGWWDVGGAEAASVAIDSSFIEGVHAQLFGKKTFDVQTYSQKRKVRKRWSSEEYNDSPEVSSQAFFIPRYLQHRSGEGT